MASSSSSKFLKKHDVFLSFRGEDTRGGFTSHLWEALKQKKLETYIDYRLEKGGEISEALIKAIEESHVSVVILSENYASSKWCLGELAKIVECKREHGQVVIPVFYNTDPSHVRKQTGTYYHAFAKHESDPNCNAKQLHTWRAALTHVANLAGWDSQTYRTESQFIKDIVADVIEKLKPKYPTELKGLVGIEENYAMVESMLEIESSEVRMVGIWGMGGIGKTTLATALHVNLSSQFEGHCFLTSVRERSEKHGLDVLRNELFSNLLEEQNLHLNIPKAEYHFVSSRLSRKRVFIVLDDVATSEQLEYLISDYDCLGPGSRVIVTTRDRHIFSNVDGIYKVKELNLVDSLQLFCLNAFRERYPKFGYQELSKSVITYCKGNPLALKVLGSRLRSRSIEAWESELRKLRKMADVKIHNVLKLSYDELDCTEQNIFLDIACFLKGESRDHVTNLLEACGFFAAIGIEELLDKSLITISNVNKIEMHDLIQEMGHEIVHQESLNDPGRRSRLWDPEEVYSVLKSNKGTEAVEGISLDVSKIDVLNLSNNSFANMANIRYLKFYSGNWSVRSNIYLPNGLQSLSDKLRYLQWHGYCLESLPSTFNSNLLVELSMPNSRLEKLWDGVQNLVNLKEIDLSFSKHLIEVPDLSLATNLEVLSLLECKSLSRVHPSILSLNKLKYLDLEGCTEIESIQTDVHLNSLCHIRLCHCSGLKEFSISSNKLENLWLDGTLITEVPSSIWRCEKLNLVSLKGCDNLDNFRNVLSNDMVKGSVTFLILSECKQLNSSNLCFILNGFRSLKTLHVENCLNLRALPDIYFLSSLQTLLLSGSNVESLPASIKDLLMLKELRLDNCKKLMSLPELPPSLQMLSAINCTSLDTDLNQLLTLEHSISFSLKHGLKERPQFVVLPGAQVPDRFSFQAGDNSITVYPLPRSGLCGFIFCLVLSQLPPNSNYEFAECLVNTFSNRTRKTVSLGNHNMVSDHVLFWYSEIKNSGNNLDNSFLRETHKGGLFGHDATTFKFHVRLESSSYLSWSEIKGCGVCPVYASEYGYSSKQQGFELELGGSSKDIIDLESNSAKGIHKLQLEYQTKNLQEVMYQTIKTAQGFKREPEVPKDEDCCTSSLPGNDITHFYTSDINSNQTLELSEVKDLTTIQVNKCSDPAKLERAQSPVEIGNPHVEPDWDPISELESILSNSSNLSPKSIHLTTISEIEVKKLSVTAILHKLETLLETTLETLSSDCEVKQQFHHVLEQLHLFEDQVPMKLRPIIGKLKKFIEDVDVGFATAQNTIEDYDKLLQSRFLLSKKLESAKVRKHEINSKASRGKVQLEKMNSEIFQLEQKLSGLVETREKLQRELDNNIDEKSKLMSEVAQWVPKCKKIIIALKKSETSYKVALTNMKKAEDEWTYLKKAFIDNKI
ncbi:hypothetical protein RJT34_00159 [Clitoria ternatea]|uniref:ADP-ribosyl cyclase/cyclic ADP-ribose hydrolase n=1 Tax=Clitoria ternatea TaxID=43366 RepID=A0AAN9KIW9_CLITE